MAFRFTDGGTVGELAEPVLRRLWHFAVGGRRQWHNRVFSPSQAIASTDDGHVLRWRGKPPLFVRRIEDLPRFDETVSILASGPSAGGLRRPERLFARPVACVNGSISLAHDLGRRADYAFVSDYRFVLDKPDLFRLVLRTADRVVLGPIVAFAAMLAVPDALAMPDGVGSAALYLREDIRRPFKRRRPSIAALRADPSLIVAPQGDLAFSLDPARGTCPSGTVVYDALQILFGIGYREVAMFGVDCSDAPRFYAEDSPAPTNLAASYATQIEPAFALVAEYLRRSGNVLVNGSPQSRLPAGIVPKADGDRLVDAVATGLPLEGAVGSRSRQQPNSSLARGRFARDRPFRTAA